MKVVWCCAVLLALFENWVNSTPQNVAPRTSAVERNPLLQHGEKIVHEENSPHQRTVVIKRKRDLPVSPFASSGGSRGNQGSFQQQSSGRSNQGGGFSGNIGFSANQFAGSIGTANSQQGLFHGYNYQQNNGLTRGLSQSGNSFSNGFNSIQQLPNTNLPVSSFRNQNIKGHGHGYNIGSSSANSFSGNNQYHNVYQSSPHTGFLSSANAYSSAINGFRSSSPSLPPTNLNPPTAHAPNSYYATSPGFSAPSVHNFNSPSTATNLFSSSHNFNQRPFNIGIGGFSSAAGIPAARNNIHNNFPRENYNPPHGSSPGTIYTGNFPPGYNNGSAGGPSSSYLPPVQANSNSNSYSYPKPQSVYNIPQPPATTYGVPEPSTSYGVPRSQPTQPQSVYGVPLPDGDEELPPEFVNGELFGKSMYTYIGKDGITRGVEGNVKFMATGKPKKLGISAAAAGSLAGGGLG